MIGKYAAAAVIAAVCLLGGSVAVAASATDTDTPTAATSPEGGPASLDDRVSKPMFDAAQDIAAIHRCDRMIRVRQVDGDNGTFFSACPGSSTPIEIACNGASCHEAAPHG